MSTGKVMSASASTPINKNFLSQLEFKFVLKRAPHVNFFVQRVNIPKLNLQSWTMPTPLINVPVYGEHLDFAPLAVEFKVDEDMQNYLEIHNWLIGLGTPDRLEQFADLKNKPKYTGEGIYSDISVMVMSSTKSLNYEIIYKDAYPTSLSDLVFSTTQPDVDYIEAMATFDYTSYTINRI